MVTLKFKIYFLFTKISLCRHSKNEFSYYYNNGFIFRDLHISISWKTVSNSLNIIELTYVHGRQHKPNPRLWFILAIQKRTPMTHLGKSLKISHSKALIQKIHNPCLQWSNNKNFSYIKVLICLLTAGSTTRNFSN